VELAAFSIVERFGVILRNGVGDVGRRRWRGACLTKSE
jgi:hypothetical protein